MSTEEARAVAGFFAEAVLIGVVISALASIFDATWRRGSNRRGPL